MVEVETKRFSRRLIILLGLVSLLLLLILGPYLLVKGVEDRRWNEMRRDCEAIAREMNARDPVRPVLRGSPEPGNAWDDYARARSASKGLRIGGAVDFLRSNPRGDRDKAEADVTLLTPAIQALQSGTRKGIARRIVDWKDAEFGVLLSEHAAGAALCQARLLSEAGQSRKSQELALDVAQYGLDLGRSGGLLQLDIGLGTVDWSLDELRRQILTTPGTREDLVDVTRELAVLERNFPLVNEACQIEAMQSGFLFLSTGEVPALLKAIEEKEKKIPTWKFAGSDRILMAGAFQEILSALRREGEAQRRPWAEAVPVKVAIRKELQSSRNPLCSIFPFGSDGKARPPTDPVRDALAQLRLLRVAAHWLATSELLTLEDPFGTILQYRLEGARLRVWSVGRNGVDDLGEGEWSPFKGKDIVLEVTRN